MIISASRRTDIPTYYSDWFFNRLNEEYVLVRNPMNIHQVSRISLSPDIVDGIVFWTKNPVPMLNRLSELERYNYYFQFTLTAYDKDAEPNIPSKNNILIPAFQQLSKSIGREKVVCDMIQSSLMINIQWNTIANISEHWRQGWATIRKNVP